MLDFIHSILSFERYGAILIATVFFSYFYKKRDFYTNIVLYIGVLHYLILVLYFLVLGEYFLIVYAVFCYFAFILSLLLVFGKIKNKKIVAILVIMAWMLNYFFVYSVAIDGADCEKLDKVLQKKKCMENAYDEFDVTLVLITGLFLVFFKKLELIKYLKK